MIVPTPVSGLVSEWQVRAVNAERCRMNRKTIESLAKALAHQRDRLFKEAADSEADLAFIAEDRDSKLEERAQEERAAGLLARLDICAKHAIEEIDAALQRIKTMAGTGPARRADGLSRSSACARCQRHGSAWTVPARGKQALLSPRKRRRSDIPDHFRQTSV